MSSSIFSLVGNRTVLKACCTEPEEEVAFSQIVCMGSLAKNFFWGVVVVGREIFIGESPLQKSTG